MFLMVGLHKDVKNSNFEIFENALYMKSGSMPLTSGHIWDWTDLLQHKQELY